jgi:hypothetical protein
MEYTADAISVVIDSEESASAFVGEASLDPVVINEPHPRGVVFKSFDFSAALEWVVEHNMGTRVFMEKLINENGERFFANVQIVSEMEFRVLLTEAIAGRVDVAFGA